jgi:hypothetical protein
MRLTKVLLLFAAAFATIVSCGKKDDSSRDGEQQIQTNGWPDYVSTPLAGTVLGQSWQAHVAVATPSANDSNYMTVFIYGEDLPDPCRVFTLPAAPYVTVKLPKSLQLTEYLTDQNSLGPEMKYLMKFASFSPSSNLWADRTKVAIQSISGTGFRASFYGQTGLQGDLQSEINGVTEVVSCESP